jgi:CYTH domain-containing protein
MERRYLLKTTPSELALAGNGWRITDRYLPGTRLRLRQMESLADGRSVFKLTQKYRSENQAPTETTITNMYLDEAEYERLKLLEARVLEKTRHPYRFQDRVFSIDIFEGRRRGLILAEVEWDEAGRAEEIHLPGFMRKDVTSDPFFRGGNLAMMPDEDFRRGLAAHL